MICNSCRQEKPEEAFGFRNRTRNIRHRTCKMCKAAYDAAHYQSNRDTYLQRGKTNALRHRRELHRRIIHYLSTHPCIDCGESNPIVLEFDHRDPETKVMSIHRLKTQRYSWETILAEIEKCDVRCANCHRRRTAQQFGWDAFYFACLSS